MPCEKSLSYAKRISDMAKTLQADDILITLISGNILCVCCSDQAAVKYDTAEHQSLHMCIMTYSHQYLLMIIIRQLRLIHPTDGDAFLC